MASALSNRQNCTCARKTLQTQRGRTHGIGCVRQWLRIAQPLGERRYENWNTHTDMDLNARVGMISNVKLKKKSAERNIKAKSKNKMQQSLVYYPEKRIYDSGSSS